MASSGRPAQLTDIVCCARCGGKLAAADDGHRCERCGAAFPSVGRIPCLVDDPSLWRTVWLRRLDDYTSQIESRVQELQRQAEAPDLLPRTRQRILRVASGFAQQLEAITSLFEPLDSNADAWASQAIPSRPEPGSQLAILECYDHVFRDWTWGEQECALNLDF